MARRSKTSLDGVTSLAGYEDCRKAVRGLIAGAKDGPQAFYLALADVDWFDRINKKHGTAVGDEVLRATAEHLRCACSEGASVFRVGADHFALLLPGVEKEDAFLLMESARSAFDKEHALSAGAKNVRIAATISIGISAFPHDADSVQDLLRKAEDATHRAKTSGRNKVCLAREERMVTKTSHYTPGQLERLATLAEKENAGEAVLLREALDDLLRKYKVSPGASSARAVG